MTIVAMTIENGTPHPGADALRIYTLAAPGEPSLTVVANTDSVYAVGDRVAVAKIGTVLADGNKIRKARLRGVDSFGMILEAVDAPAGEDLSHRYGVSPPIVSHGETVPLAKWASIELLHHVRRDLQARAALGQPLPRVTYRAKVKLDGTNAALHATPGGFVAQSRTRILSVEDDNYGFAAWACEHARWMSRLHDHLGRAIVFGEWCGAGIQKRTAISRLDRKVLAIFAVQLGDPNSESAQLLVDPDRIRNLLPEHPDVFVLPWHGEPVLLDYGDVAQLTAAAERVNDLVAEVERCDPWVASTFGHEGLGEGLVLYPTDDALFDAEGRADRDSYVELMFKAKGEKHRVTRQKKAAQLDPEIARGIEQLVDNVVTEARLEQALEQSTGNVADMRRIGDFLRWIGQDVRKETVAELEAAGLEWKDVAQAVTRVAKQWFRERAEAKPASAPT